MSETTESVVDRMQRLVAGWEPLHDRRAIFLSCYALMTRGMLEAVDSGGFRDGVWVSHLLHRFADYYFDALDRYDAQDAATPAVWRQTFESARSPQMHVLQHLILGVNAHINYDLVFALYDTLHEQWPALTPADILRRYEDHCQVNAIIYRTIDAVQDGIIERYSPAMDLVDKGFLRADELMLGWLIRRWREQVWTHASELLACCNDSEVSALRERVSDRTVLRGQAVLLNGGLSSLRYLL
jgi:hypothetical protein